MSDLTNAPVVRPIAEIGSYHAHIYYDVATTRPVAEWLRERIGERFSVQLGRWHDALVGPHTQSMYQVAFTTDLFEIFVPWLMLNRNGLDVLVHPNTDNQRRDHLVNALWLGNRLALLGDRLPEGTGTADGRISPVVPNTSPTLRP